MLSTLLGLAFLLLPFVVPLGILVFVIVATSSENSGLARNVKVLAINSLQVFDVAKTSYPKNPFTTLGLRVDSQVFRKIVLAGVQDPSSGANTLGAFEGSRSETLLAWLDPVSRQCFVVRRLSPGSTFALTCMPFVICIVSGKLGWLSFEATVFGVVVLLAAAAFLAWYRASRRDQICSLLSEALSSNTSIQGTARKRASLAALGAPDLKRYTDISREVR